MKGTQLFSLAGIGVLLYFLSRGALSSFSKLIEIKKPEIGGNLQVDLSGISGNIFLPVVNKQSVSIPIDAIEGDIIFNNRSLGRFSTDSVIIDGNNTSRIPIPINSSWGNLIDNVTSIFSSDGNLVLKVQGTVTTKGVKVPFSHNINVI